MGQRDVPDPLSPLTRCVVSDNSRHHTEPWVPHLESKPIGQDIFICKYKAQALADSAHLAGKPCESDKLREGVQTGSPRFAGYHGSWQLSGDRQHLEKVLSGEGPFSGRIFGECSFGRNWKLLKNVGGKLLGPGPAQPGAQLSTQRENVLFFSCQSHS